MAAKRKAISLETKKDIIDDSQHGVKNSELCRKYNLDRTTVSMIIRNKQNILNAIEKGASACRARIYRHSDLDEALLEWIKIQNSKNVPFNGPLLKACLKIEKIKELKIPEKSVGTL
uniref:HTH psq-type domain-containing protein n=1 Tax=Meloidogyne hapla TaxID=6305 RepID=A0A1I8BGV8_MELHA